MKLLINISFIIFIMSFNGCFGWLSVGNEHTVCEKGYEDKRILGVCNKTPYEIYHERENVKAYVKRQIAEDIKPIKRRKRRFGTKGARR